MPITGRDSLPRILMINSSSGVGGAEKHIVQLSRGLVARRYDVHVASPPEGPLVQAVEDVGAVHHPVSMYPDPPSLGQILEIRRVMRRCRPDIVHIHGVRAGLIGRLAYPVSFPSALITRTLRPNGSGHRFRGPAVIYTVHGAHFLHYPWPRNRIFALIERALGSVTDRVVFVSRADLLGAVRAEAVAAGRGVVVHNGIAVPPAQSPEVRSDVRQELGLSDDQPLMLSVGRLSQAKDYPSLLRALALLRDRGLDNVLLAIAGGGEEESALREVADQLRLPSTSLLLLGVRDDPERLMKAADLFVMSSRQEGFPYAILEAMAEGLPVVATKVGGIPELLGGAGCLVGPGRPDEIAATVQGLLANFDGRRALGRLGRQRVEAHFTEQSMLDENVALYKQVRPDLASAGL